MKKHNRDDAKWFVPWVVVALLMIWCILQAGCQMVKGACKDVIWLAEGTETVLTQQQDK